MKIQGRFLLALNSFTSVFKAFLALALHRAPSEGLGETKPQIQQHKPITVSCEAGSAHPPLQAGAA